MIFFSWLPLPLCFPSLSLFLISLLAAAAALSFSCLPLRCCYKMIYIGLVYLFHPFPGFEWDVSQACLPLLPWCPTFLEVLSGVYAGILFLMVPPTVCNLQIVYIYIYVCMYVCMYVYSMYTCMPASTAIVGKHVCMIRQMPPIDGITSGAGMYWHRRSTCVQERNTLVVGTVSSAPMVGHAVCAIYLSNLH